MGSDLMKSLGVGIAIDYRDYNISGFTEVIANIFKILGLKDKAINEIKKFQPDVLVLVDYAGFNLEVAKTLKQLAKKCKGKPNKNPEEKWLSKLKIIEYIAPQLWASRPWRIKKVKKNVDKVLSTLPFEEELYKKANIPVTYVGNPVVASMTEPTSKKDFFNSIDIDTKNKEEPILIGVFPGSRGYAVHQLLPLMVEAAYKLKERFNKEILFVLGRAPTISKEYLYSKGLKKAEEDGLIKILDPEEIENSNHRLLSAADCLWLSSGTVTLEASCYGTPHFLTFRGNWIDYQAYKLVRIINIAGLANIIAQKCPKFAQGLKLNEQGLIVKELLQNDATVENFIRETEAWIKQDGSPTDYYKNIESNLLKITNKLREKDTAKLVANEINSIV